MPLQNGSIVYIYYVKAWDSEEDYRNLKPPVKHYLFNEKEGVAFDTGSWLCLRPVWILSLPYTGLVVRSRGEFNIEY